MFLVHFKTVKQKSLPSEISLSQSSNEVPCSEETADVEDNSDFGDNQCDSESDRSELDQNEKTDYHEPHCSPQSSELWHCRMLKRDMRRQYSSMFANVMNSFDTKTVRCFARKFLAEDVLFSSKTQTPNVTGRSFDAFCLQGRDLFIYFSCAMQQLLPDSFLQISETKIQFNSETHETILISKFDYSATFLYQLDHATLAEYLSLQYPKDTSKELLSEVGDKESGKKRKREESDAADAADSASSAGDPRDWLKSYDPEHPESLHLLVPLRIPPKVYEIEGRLVLVLNSERLVQKILYFGRKKLRKSPT